MIEVFYLHCKPDIAFACCVTVAIQVDTKEQGNGSFHMDVFVRTDIPGRKVSITAATTTTATAIIIIIIVQSLNAERF